ncbi:MAG: hypothetical protein AAGJ09_03055 [Pseudomonadota bacterium]
MKHLWVLLCALSCLLGHAGPAAAKSWHVAETEKFRVYSDGSKNELRKLAQTMEDFDAFLRAFTGLTADPPPDRFDLYLVRSADELRRYTPLPPSIDGFYQATPTGTAAFSARSKTMSGDPAKLWYSTSQQILFHEYAHHFMERYFPYPYPRWYSEGFAEYVSTVQFKRKKIIVGGFAKGRVGALLYGAWLPMDVLLSPQTMPLGERETAAFYAQSWLLAHYMLSSPERLKKLQDFLSKFSTQDSVAEDFRDSFAMPIGQLGRELREYLDGTSETMKVYEEERPKRPDIAVRITKLPPSASDFLTMSAKLDLGIEPPFRATLLADIDQALVKYPKDALAQRTWAHANILYGDRAAGRSRLEALEKAYPDDAKICFYLGMSYILDGASTAQLDAEMQKKRQAARGYFADAFRMNPNHYPTLYYYFRSVPKPATAQQEAVLEKAEFLAPQVGQIRYDLATMWAARPDSSHRTAAKRLLQILANDPHEVMIASMARARLEALLSAQ